MRVLPLLTLLRTGESGDVFVANVRARAVEALERLGDRRAVDPLLADLEALRRAHAGLDGPRVPSEAIYYYYVIRALGKLGDPRAEPLKESGGWF
jgi:HEAT repeat protein